MNLGKQIHTLLKRQPQVFVKKLGVFTRVHTSASFDEKRKVYLPPLSYIEFDKDSTEGYDFVQYVQQVNQIDYQEAELLIEEEVDKLINQITKFGQVSLDNLGHIVSFGDSYVFKPLDLQGFNFAPVEDAFASKVASSDDESVEVKAEEVGVSVPTESVVNVVEEPSENEELDPSTEVVTEKVEEENTVVTAETLAEEKAAALPPTAVPPTHYHEELREESRSNAGTYIFLALLAIAAIGGIYYYLNYIQPNNGLIEDDQELSLVDTNFTDVDTLASDSLLDSALLAHADSILSAEQDTLNSTSQEQEDVVAPVQEPAQQAKTEKEEIKKFTIIIGTHKTLAQAYEQAEAFHKDGHKSVRVVTPNLAKNFKRVIWDTYATKEERDAALIHVRKHIIADAWPDTLK